MDQAPTPPPRPVHPLVNRLAAYGWRIIVIAIVVVGLVWLIGRLRIVVAASLVALMVSRGLIAPVNWLGRRGFPPAAAALTAMVGLLLLLTGLGVTIGATAANEFDEVGPAIESALDDIEDWIVEEAPVEVSRAEVDELRDDARDRAEEVVRASSGQIVSGARLLFEVVAGFLLAVITTFFFLKDGARLGEKALQRFPAQRHEELAALGSRAWTTLGGYLRGAALLGVVEALAIGITLLLVGAKLVAPVMVVTALGAFVPIVGAVLAGVIAFLVTLATAGLGPAMIVAVVAFVVQQLDNDLLAPVIYGRALQLHPLVILFSITSGAALFGAAGAIVAVPLAAVALNVASEYRSRRSDQPSQAPPKESSNASRAGG